MKARILGPVLITLGWPLACGEFLVSLCWSCSHAVESAALRGTLLLTILILPGAGGFLTGWHWRGYGILLAFVGLLSSIPGAFVFFSLILPYWLDFCPPRGWLEGPVGIMPLLVAVPGTGVALAGVLLGIFVRWAFQRKHRKPSNEFDG